MRKWLGGVNSCTTCGSGCIGCTEKVFPDTGDRGLYMHRRAELDEFEGSDDGKIIDAHSSILRSKEYG